MKKIFSLALSAVVACGLIAGCGGSAKKEAAKPAKPAVPKKIVVGLDGINKYLTPSRAPSKVKV